MTTDRRTEWQERSRVWGASAAQGRSDDDDFNQMIVAAAGIIPGERVLDLASGTGNPAISIALAMNGEGAVTCTDFAPGMLETARRRARNLSLSIMRFACCDMRALPFADASFDCVTCRFGIMQLQDREAALSEAYRVLRPGGRAAFAVWGAYAENPPFHVPRRAVAVFFGEDEGPEPVRHSMSAPGTLERALNATGFARTEERPLRYERRVSDPEAYVMGGLERTFKAKLGALSAPRRAALIAAVLGAWRPYRVGEELRVPNYARLGIGWKPSGDDGASAADQR